VDISFIGIWGLSSDDEVNCELSPGKYIGESGRLAIRSVIMLTFLGDDPGDKCIPLNDPIDGGRNGGVVIKSSC
jgi:hypothetical protein